MYQEANPLSLSLNPCSSPVPRASSIAPSSCHSSHSSSGNGPDIVAQLRDLSAEHPFLDIPQPSGHGQPLRVMLLRKPRVGSADGSKRTLCDRSHLIEKVIAAISVPPAAMGSRDEERHVRAQLVHTVKRSRGTYEAVVRKAGLDVQVRCGPDEMVELKAITGLPYGAQRVLRTFLQSKSIDVFSSEHKLRAAVKQLELPCEVGQFTAEDEEQQPQGYARIPASQLWSTIRSIAIARFRRRELVWWPKQPTDTLFFLTIPLANIYFILFSSISTAAFTFFYRISSRAFD